MMIFQSGKPENFVYRPLLGGLPDTSLLDTGCTDFHALDFSLHNSANALQIRIPSPVCYVMRMTDVMSIYGLLATNFTNFCHLILRNFH